MAERYALDGALLREMRDMLRWWKHARGGKPASTKPQILVDKDRRIGKLGGTLDLHDNAQADVTPWLWNDDDEQWQEGDSDTPITVRAAPWLDAHEDWPGSLAAETWVVIERFPIVGWLVVQWTAPVVAWVSLGETWDGSAGDACQVRQDGATETIAATMEAVTGANLTIPGARPCLVVAQPSGISVVVVQGQEVAPVCDLQDAPSADALQLKTRYLASSVVTDLSAWSDWAETTDQCP